MMITAFTMPLFGMQQHRSTNVSDKQKNVYNQLEKYVRENSLGNPSYKKDSTDYFLIPCEE